MNKPVFPKLHLNIFEGGLILAVVVLNIVGTLFSKEIDWVASIASIAGVVGVVLTAKGHLACYIFGLIQVSLYIFISWKSKFYGEVMLNGLYFLPMQVIGFYTWRERLGKQNLVKASTMTTTQRIILLSITAICALAYGWWLDYLGGKAPYLDSISTILSIVAMMLMVRAFVEQWILWMVVNIVTIVMWVIAYIDHEDSSLLMIVMWSLFLINSVYGFLNWQKLSKTNDTTTP